MVQTQFILTFADRRHFTEHGGRRWVINGLFTLNKLCNLITNIIGQLQRQVWSQFPCNQGEEIERLVAIAWKCNVPRWRLIWLPKLSYVQLYLSAHRKDTETYETSM